MVHYMLLLLIMRRPPNALERLSALEHTVHDDGKLPGHRYHREALACKSCMHVSAKPIDDVLAERLVTAVTPLTIQLALEALTNLEERDQTIAAQWDRRIERARYDTELAERRYEAVDPANRLIASTLEQRWNDAMQRLLELEAELAAFKRQAMRAINAEQKRQILKLGRNFPQLWAAPTTTA